MTDLALAAVSNPMLGAALECARNGLPVYPAKPKGKNPLRKGWQRSATTKVESLREHWRCHPAANVGIACRGLVVLDADSERGEDAVEERCLPETTRVRTRRGSHWYFLGGHAGAKLAALPDVELRGKGQGVLGPGSIHPSGHEYEWEIPPWEVAPRALPDEIRELVKTKSVSGLVSEGHLVFPGGRHEYLLGVAASARARHAVVDIATVLHSYNAVQCSPPLPKEEVDRLAQQAAKLPVLPWLADPTVFCMDDERLSMPAQLVLFRLCRHADYKGECFPSVRRLAAQVGCRTQTVTDAVKELERFGRIAVKRSRRGNRYRILPWTPMGEKGLTSVTPTVTPVEGYLRVDRDTGEIAA